MDSHIQSFLQSTGWDGASVQQFPADWSSRHYARLTKQNGETAILLQSPPDDSPDSVVGHKIGEWYRLNKHFASIGINVPSIHAHDLSIGLILMEDFGVETIVDQGVEAYMAATNTLITMRQPQNLIKIDLIKYEKTHVYNALSFFPEFILENKNLTTEWLRAWNQVEKELPACPRALTHIDFGAANLMWMPDRDGIDAIGVLDFQAACDGPFVYDIVNLLEDARRTIPSDIKQKCIDHYCAQLSPHDRHAFEAWFPVITAQFHARVLGQIIKLKQDKGRSDLMQFFTPLWERFEKELQTPALAPVAKFMKDNHKK